MLRIPAPSPVSARQRLFGVGRVIVQLMYWGVLSPGAELGASLSLVSMGWTGTACQMAERGEDS